jgi:hypothetical protein
MFTLLNCLNSDASPPDRASPEVAGTPGQDEPPEVFEVAARSSQLVHELNELVRGRVSAAAGPGVHGEQDKAARVALANASAQTQVREAPRGRTTVVPLPMLPMPVVRPARAKQSGDEAQAVTVDGAAWAAAREREVSANARPWWQIDFKSSLNKWLTTDPVDDLLRDEPGQRAAAATKRKTMSTWAATQPAPSGWAHTQPLGTGF